MKNKRSYITYHLLVWYPSLLKQKFQSFRIISKQHYQYEHHLFQMNSNVTKTSVAVCTLTESGYWFKYFSYSMI